MSDRPLLAGCDKCQRPYATLVYSGSDKEWDGKHLCETCRMGLSAVAVFKHLYSGTNNKGIKE